MSITTGFKTPTLVVSNGTVTSNPFLNPNNILVVDGNTANSTGVADITLGGYNFNIPVGSIIEGIEVELIAYRGAQTSPVITISPDFYDNVNGADDYYPYTTPFAGLTDTLATYTLGTSTYKFGTTISVNQINNFKLNILVNGEVYVDSALVNVYYTTPATETITYNTLAISTFQVGETIIGSLSGATAEVVTDNGVDIMTVTSVVGVFLPGETITGQTSNATALIDANTVGVCTTCESPIQVQAMYLYTPFLIGDTKFYLQPNNFCYPDGTPVQPGDTGACGGKIYFTFDESKRKQAGSNWEENAVMDTSVGTWTVLPSGVVEMDLGVVTNRGLDFKYPGNHVANLMSDHDANSKVVISNSAPYELQKVRLCQVDTVFSPPITVQDEGVTQTASLHLLDFLGEGVNAGLTALHNIGVFITDRLLRATATDTNSAYLDDKFEIVNGSNTTVVKTLQNPGANEKISYQINATGGGGSGGHVIQDDGVAMPTEPALNFRDYFTASDTAGVSTNIDINTTELGADADLGDALGGNTNLINTLTSNSTFQTLINNFVLSSQGNFQVDQTPLGAGSTYGLLVGTLGSTSTFTVSEGMYVSGKIQVFLNGIIQLQGSGEDWVETSPAAGTITFNSMPAVSSIITVIYEKTTVPLQKSLQFEDEGSNLGTAGTVTEVDFTGAGVTASRLGDKVTVNIPAGGGGSGTTITGTAGEDISADDAVFQANGGEIKVLGDFAAGWNSNNSGDIVSGITTQYRGTIFTIPYDCILDKIALSGKAVNCRIGTYTYELRNESGGAIGNTVIATSGPKVLSTNAQQAIYLFTGLNIAVNAGDKYAVVKKWVGTANGSAFDFNEAYASIDNTYQTSFTGTNGTVWTPLTTHITPVNLIIYPIVNKIYKTDLDMFNSKYHGLAQTSESVGDSITATTLGSFTTTGLTADTKYYVKNTTHSLSGNYTSRFDITNVGGSTMRYTYDGTGANPNITALTFPINQDIYIQAPAFNANNNGRFTVTGSGTDYFEITNASGVPESNKVIGTSSNRGYIYKLYPIGKIDTTSIGNEFVGRATSTTNMDVNLGYDVNISLNGDYSGLSNCIVAFNTTASPNGSAYGSVLKWSAQGSSETYCTLDPFETRGFYSNNYNTSDRVQGSLPLPIGANLAIISDNAITYLTTNLKG